MGFEAPEKVRTQRDIAFAREPIRQVAHDLVDAENFLDDDDTRFGIGIGSGAVCGLREVA